MEIDELKEKYDLSDHNLLSASFIMNHNQGMKEKGASEQITYLRMNDESKKLYVETLNKICIEKKIDETCMELLVQLTACCANLYNSLQIYSKEIENYLRMNLRS